MGVPLFKRRLMEKHLETLRETLESGEDFLYVAYATMVTSGDLGTDGGALAVTNSRVLFSGSAAMLGTSSSASIKLSDIDGVASGERMIKGSLIQPYLEINAAGAAYYFNLRASDASEAQEAINKARAKTENKVENGQAPESTATQLEKLASLLEQGLISRDEFEEEKKRLLNKRA